MKTATINLHDETLINAFKYPAGEWQVRLTEEGLKLLDDVTDVTVVARINNSDDIIRFNLLVDAVYRINGDYHCPTVNAVIPYFPASRADRRFVRGDCHGLNVYASMLNGATGLRNISTLDIHNLKGLDTIDAMFLRNVSAEPFIHQAIIDFAKDCGTDRIAVLFPDEGARKRYKIDDSFIGSNAAGVGVELYHASKKRNPETGEFLGFDVPQLPDLPVLIVDDLCDGGGTFNGIAAADGKKSVERGLYVSHGIFSKGMSDLKSNFGHIYTTNSHGNAIMFGAMGYVTVYDCIPDLKAALK